MKITLIVAEATDVNMKSGKGETPPHSTAAAGYMRVAERLLDHGTDINVKDVEKLHPTSLRRHEV